MYKILDLNPQLMPFAGDIDLRMFLYRATKNRILGKTKTLNDFANAHDYYGFHHVDGGWYYREWAPSAYQLYLEGEFNNWNQTSHPLTKLESKENGIQITWDAINGAERYRVYVKSGKSWKVIGTPTENGFLWTGAEEGKTYTFTVRSVDADNTVCTSNYNTTGWSIKHQ